MTPRLGFGLHEGDNRCTALVALLRKVSYRWPLTVGALHCTVGCSAIDEVACAATADMEYLHAAEANENPFDNMESAQTFTSAPTSPATVSMTGYKVKMAVDATLGIVDPRMTRQNKEFIASPVV